MGGMGGSAGDNPRPIASPMTSRTCVGRPSLLKTGADAINARIRASGNMKTASQVSS